MGMVQHRDMGKRIQSARIEAGFETADAFAEQLPVKTATVRSWEQGRSRPDHDLLPVLARLTGKSISWFYGEEETAVTDEIRKLRMRLDAMQEPPLPADLIPVHLNDTVLVPLIGEVSAGPGILAEENIEYLHRLPKTFIPKGHEDSCFLLRARGESMIDAGIQDGDLLFICNAVEVADGDIAILLVDDEAVVKRVYRKNGTLVLVSENPSYPPREVDEARLIGRVMWIRRNF